MNPNERKAFARKNGSAPRHQPFPCAHVNHQQQSTRSKLQDLRDWWPFGTGTEPTLPSCARRNGTGWRRSAHLLRRRSQASSTSAACQCQGCLPGIQVILSAFLPGFRARRLGESDSCCKILVSLVDFGSQGLQCDRWRLALGTACFLDCFSAVGERRPCSSEQA